MQFGAAGVAGPTPEEFEAFLAANPQLNPNVVAVLRSQPPEAQLRIMQQHQGAFNQTQRSGQGAAAQVQVDTVAVEETQDFETWLAQNPQLNENVVATLRSQAPEVQQRIMAQQRKGAAARAVNNGANIDQLIEQFVAENFIDEVAAGFLRLEEKYVKQAVINGGSLAGCANPSAALLERVKNAKQSGPREPRGGWNGGMGMGGGWQQPQQEKAPAPMNHMGASMMSMMMQGQSAGAGASPEEVEAFIVQYQLDDRAASALREEEPEVQRAVIDRGGFTGASNASAAVLGRIKATRKYSGKPRVFGKGVAIHNFHGDSLKPSRPGPY
eukprot:gnl/TRDRNA2_/TRDRNA2_193117_c0_seq1.p1 gnl/TRDRNA2_/TRDRNA2_193117_c0~~gnl/TRDRNA2_/TRDRNA2_193117_c0_seq1.p1  ORF type:complete len:327 (+),score=63.62 gnl/TRDRNA2_/TRDRNA2_193117_c0_seq1:56-1036(+)